MNALDLFSIGSWTLFDHLLRVGRLPREGETLPLAMSSAELEQVHFGDCSANIAAVAARLRLKTGLGMVVGDDFVTSGYRDHLSAVGVDLTGVEIRPGGRSGHSYNIFATDGQGFCLSHLGVAANQDGWHPPLTEVDRARAVVVSEMFSLYTLGAIERARQRGALTAINGMVASGGELLERFLAAADILFLSRGEARELLATIEAADPADVLAFGPRLVVVTQGSGGSRWYARDGVQETSAVAAATMVDTTGAGDAFVAGALWGMLSGFDLQTSRRCAATVASFVIEAWGCQTNLPSPDEVRHRYRDQFGEDLPRCG